MSAGHAYASLGTLERARLEATQITSRKKAQAKWEPEDVFHDRDPCWIWLRIRDRRLIIMKDEPKGKNGARGVSAENKKYCWNYSHAKRIARQLQARLNAPPEDSDGRGAPKQKLWETVDTMEKANA